MKVLVLAYVKCSSTITSNTTRLLFYESRRFWSEYCSVLGTRENTVDIERSGMWDNEIKQHQFKYYNN